MKGAVFKLILGFHPRDETAILVKKIIENGPTSFA